jgi:hypothetical protein
MLNILNALDYKKKLIVIDYPKQNNFNTIFTFFLIQLNFLFHQTIL